MQTLLYVFSAPFSMSLALENGPFLFLCSCTETLNHGGLPPLVLCKNMQLDHEIHANGRLVMGAEEMIVR